MSFVGRYINMEISTGRRAAIEAQLEALGAADLYARFPAVDGRPLDPGASSLSPTELGCFLSHYQLLLEAADRSVPTHIVEDDVVFSAEAVKLVEAATQAQGLAFDALFTDIFVAPDFHTLYRLFKAFRASGAVAGRGGGPIAIQFVSLTGCVFASCASYIVTPAGAAKLAAGLAAELAKGAALPVDMVYRQLISSGEVAGLCMTPFITSVDPDQVGAGVIARKREDRTKALAFFMQRYFFFIDRDNAKMKAWAELLSEGEPPDSIDFLWPGVRYLIRHGRAK